MVSPDDHINESSVSVIDAFWSSLACDLGLQVPGEMSYTTALLFTLHNPSHSS